MSRVSITREKLDDLALHVSAKSGEDMPLTIDGMMDAVDGIDLDDKFIVTIYYTANSKWDEVPYIPDCTYTELEAAYASGKKIVFRLDQDRKGPVLSAYADGYTDFHDGRVSAWYLVHTTEYDPESYDYRANTDYSISETSTQFYWAWREDDEDGYIGYFGRSVNIWPYGKFNVTASNIGSGTVTIPSYRQCSIPILTLPTTTASSRITGTLLATISPSTSIQYLNIPYGFNKTQGSYALSAMPTGTAGTPTATKGTVSNHSVSVTPSVTNTTGYITGGTKTGTAVTVSASELVSGTLSITSSGTKDVTNYASASVAAGGATASATKGTVSNHSVTVTPSVTRTAGYVTAGTSNGTAVTVSASELVSGSETKTANGTYDVTNLASLVVAIPIVTYYTSSSNPTSSQGNNNDIWLVTQ